MRSLALPRTDEIPRYHLDWPPAVCPANPLLPDVARARGFPTQHVQSGTGANRTSRPGARRSGRSSGVNSGLLAAGGLAAGGPPSLCGDAVRPDLSVNAVVKMIAYLHFLTRSTAHEPRRTCRPYRSSPCRDRGCTPRTTASGRPRRCPWSSPRGSRSEACPWPAMHP